MSAIDIFPNDKMNKTGDFAVIIKQNTFIASEKIWENLFKSSRLFEKLNGKFKIGTRVAYTNND